jgi:hypothetical protein
MAGRLRTHALALFGREMAAYARQALLLKHDVEAPVLPPDARDRDDVIVLLHGLFATAGVLRPLRAAIARQAPAGPEPMRGLRPLRALRALPPPAAP